MITSICIQNFKALRNTQMLKMGKMTLLTGVNGRGKSSLLQMLLLLSQSILRGESLDSLLLNGQWVNMGDFGDIVNSYSEDKTLKVQIGTDSEFENFFEFTFAATPANSKIGQLTSFCVNGQEKLESFTVNESSDSKEDSVSVGTLQMVGSITDFTDLQKLRRLYYIAADRLSAQYSTNRPDGSPLWNSQGNNVMQFVSQMSNEQLHEVETVLNEVFDGATFKPDMPEGSSQVLLYLDSVAEGGKYKPVHVGYGLSYVLSLIVAGVLAQKGEIIIIENPEAHLHPTAQSHLMNWYLSTVLKKGVQVFVESHSDHIVNAALLAIKKGIARDKVEILFFDKSASIEKGVNVSNLDILPVGIVKNPPVGFCDQYANDLLNLMC